MDFQDHYGKDVRFHAATAHLYDGVVSEPRAFANELLFRRLDRLVPGGGRMLDLGCGTGQMLLRYASRHEQAEGVDHSPEMLAHARERLDRAGLDRVRLARRNLFEFLAEPGPEYDLVTCVGCLHHLPAGTLAAFFPAVASRLKRGGRLLFAEPVAVDPTDIPGPVARWNAASVMRERAAWLEDAGAEEPDEAPVEEATLRGLPEECGFELLAESRGWELFPHRIPAGWRDRWVMRRLHRRHGATGNILALLWRAS